MAEVVAGSDLINEVQARTVGLDELGRVDAALAMSRELEAAADSVVDHFVGQARAADHSWTAIAELMGVSKQAARARFAHRVERVSWGGIWVAPRLAACLDRAVAEARDRGEDEVGTDHLLIGLMEEGVAAAALERLGVSATAIREAMDHLFGSRAPGHEAASQLPAHSPTRSAHIQLSADATEAMSGRWRYLGRTRARSCALSTSCSYSPPIPAAGRGGFSPRSMCRWPMSNGSWRHACRARAAATVAADGRGRRPECRQSPLRLRQR
jgi:hypothetical protein